MSRQKLLFAIALLLTIPPSRALAQAPVFVTQTPTTGNSGNTFFVLLPLTNIGTGPASSMQLTSVALTHLGAAATTTVQPATFPFPTGSGYLGPGGVRTLDLEFDNSKLVTGNRYLLTLRGTYQASGTTFGFALNRPLIYAKGFAATHQQVIDAILTKFESRPRLDPQADDEAIVTFVKGLSQVAAADLQVSPPVVSITFSDGGEPLYLLNNVKLPSQPVLTTAAVPRSNAVLKNDTLLSSASAQPHTASLVAGVGTELPKSNQMRVLNALGSGFPTSNSDIKGWLANNGYHLVAADASVQGLRSVAGDGVFYFGTHGVAIGSFFVLWTSTPWEIACEPESLSTFCDPTLRDDVRNGLVRQVGADDFFDQGIQNWRDKNHFGINGAFIHKYWGDFAENAFVYIDACSSADLSDSRQQIFVEELFKVKHASLFAGWTGTVDNEIATDTSKLVFDRLLGADEFCPENGAPCMLGSAFFPAFAQRPFDYTQVETDLPLHSLGNSGLLIDLKFLSNPLAPGFGLLAPSIKNMVVDESEGQGGQLAIFGIFGIDPRQPPGSDADGIVTVGGPSSIVKIESWEPNAIVVDLDAGSAGDVQVVVRGHMSNVAKLTMWQGQFNMAMSGPQSISETIHYNLNLRADIRQYREVIHEAPKEPSLPFSVINNSQEVYSCSGKDTENPDPFDIYTFSWKGSGTLTPIYKVSTIGTTGPFFSVDAQLVDHRNMKFNSIVEYSPDACPANLHIETFGSPPNDIPLPNALTGAAVFGPINLNLDDSAIINSPAPANQFSFIWVPIPGSTSNTSFTFQWNPITPISPPDPKSAR